MDGHSRSLLVRGYRHAARRPGRVLFLSALVAVLAGCTPQVPHIVTAPFDSLSLQRAKDLKDQSLLLMQKAKDPPAPHAAEIQQLKDQLEIAQQAAAQKGAANAPATQQWATMNDPKGALLGGFLQKWQTENRPQSAAFIADESKIVSDAFDQIIKLENGKPKN